MQNPLARFVPHLVGEYPKNFLNLCDNISLSNGSSQDEIRDLLWQAYEFALTHHEDQKRHSGEPYFNHCVAVAQILASWGMAATKPEERKESAIRTERYRHQGTTTGLLSVKLIHIAD